MRARKTQCTNDAWMPHLSKEWRHPFMKEGKELIFIPKNWNRGRKQEWKKFHLSCPSLLTSFILGWNLKCSMMGARYRSGQDRISDHKIHTLHNLQPPNSDTSTLIYLKEYVRHAAKHRKKQKNPEFQMLPAFLIPWKKVGLF